MFGILDIATVALIEKKLMFYKNNPNRLAFILCGYHGSKEMFDLVGAEYIKDAIDYITKNKINVFPYYNLDSKQSPSISVISSGSENQQFIGDYGSHQAASQCRSVKSKPVLVAEWSAKSINKNMMTVSPELKLNTKIWPGIIITNGEYSVVLESMVDSTTLCLKSDLPDNISPVGWRAETAGTNTIYEVNASMDDVSVQCKLQTHGEPGNHRLLGVLLRAVLKSSRLDFDKIGFQNTRISYTPMILTDQEHMEYESVYSIDGVYTDHWIQKESQGPDSASNLCINVVAVNPEEGKDDVEL